MLNEQMRWQCEMFIYSCWLYENDYETVFSDSDYDIHCNSLLNWYDDIPAEFKDRISKDRLGAGTASGLVYLPEDEENAKAWFRRARGRDPLCFKDL